MVFCGCDDETADHEDGCQRGAAHGFGFVSSTDEQICIPGGRCNDTLPKVLKPSPHFGAWVTSNRV